MSKYVTVIGGAGFIGSHLVNILNKKKYDIVIYDDFSNASGKQNLPSNVKIVKGSILNYKKMHSIFKKSQLIFNLAVLPLPMSFVDSDRVVKINDYGAYLVAKLCAELKLKLIHVSSSEAYGTARYQTMKEDHPLLPTTVYAASKASSESYVRAYGDYANLKYVIVRPFNSYGEFMREDGYAAAIPNFYHRLIKNKKPIIHGSGKQTRDLTHVNDTANGIYLASKESKALGLAINIAQNREVSVLKMAKIMVDTFSELTGKKIPKEFIHVKERDGDVKRHLGNISLAKKILGYKPKIKLEDGIKKYVEWKFENTKKGIKN